MKKLIMIITVAAAVSAQAQYVTGYAEKFGDYTDIGLYSAYVLDSSKMSLTVAASVESVGGWVLDNYATLLGSEAVVGSLTTQDYDVGTGYIGFDNSSAAVDPGASPYTTMYMLALCTGGGQENIAIVGLDTYYALNGNMQFLPTSTAGFYGWEPVPEPTSGLLLIMGLAGLALRRRVERWEGGEVEGWKSGKVERWNGGKVEG